MLCRCCDNGPETDVQMSVCVCVEGGGVRAKNVETQQYIDSIAISGNANTSSSVAGENESPSSVLFYSFIFTTFIKQLCILYIMEHGFLEIWPVFLIYTVQRILEKRNPLKRKIVNL